MQIKENKPPSIDLTHILKESLNCEGSRACLFNLIVYTHEARRTAYFIAMIKMIRKQFPCRIIFITANTSAKNDEFKVSTSLEENSEKSGGLCDQIFIEASGQYIQRIYFVLFPLFVPDLPIYLLWGEDPTKDYTILPHLENFATRLIFDAEATEDLQQFSRDMLNRMHSSSFQIVDMNWARIEGWREVLAQIFDSPERFDQLAKANSIEIFYNNTPSELFIHPDTQAVYLQAWLASRLKWQFLRVEKEDESLIIHYQSNTQPHSIRLTPAIDSKFESEDILGIEVLGDKGYECHMKRIRSEQVKVQASNQSQCELPFLLLMPTLRSGRNFMQEIFFQKMSDHYESMLHLISLTRWN